MTSQPPQGSTKTVQVSIPAELHRQFRLKVLHSGTNMAHVLREFIETYVDESRKG